MGQDSPATTSISFGAFVLDLPAGRLLQDGQSIALQPRPWALLVHLCERAGQLVSKDELLDAVWGHRHVSDSVLKGAINIVRTALGDDPAAPRYIETAARRGYRFVAPITRVGGGGGAGSGNAAAAAVAKVPATPPVAAGGAGTSRLGNLPASSVTLIGREAAQAELHALLATHRLVTLIGPGGVGKTQLALNAAGQNPPADGVWLVRLEGLADGTPLLDTVARALALGANASRSVDALAAALAPLSARIVLDNAEHLIDDLVPLVAQALQAAPRLQWLLTSQIPLRVAGEALLPLAPLAVPAEEEEVADPLNFSAVALFIERVRAQQANYQPDSRELQDVGALCRLLDGLPLALELAAARVPLLGTAGVLARISDRFSLLTRGARDAAQRHRTLRQALEWSFALLQAHELQVLRRLSVFAGSFTPAMAQRVAGDAAADAGEAQWPLLDALQSLHEHSLLATDASAGGPRLRQLESVRALAAEQLRAVGEEAATRTRLAEAMRDLLRDAQTRYTSTPLLHWLPPLRPEADNLRLAMSHALAQLSASGEPAKDESSWRLAVELFSHAMLFWLRSGRKREAQGWYQALQPHVPHIRQPELRALYGLAVGAFAAYGQSLPPAEAFPWLEEAEQTFAAQGEGRSAMLALYLHAAMKQRIAPTEDRSALLARMRALERPDWLPRERNFAAWTAAVNAHGHGDVQTFREFCAEDLARARAGDDLAEAWLAAFGLGQALWILGEREQATRTLEEAVTDLRRCGLLREYATTAALAASMRLALRSQPGATAVQPQELHATLREAADVTRAEGMLWWMGDALMLLPVHRADWASAMRLQRWIDERMNALGMKRSPVAATLRETFDQLLAQARAAPSWREPEPPVGSTLDDAEVLRLAFA